MINEEIIRHILEFANYRCLYCGKILDLKSQEIIRYGSFKYCSSKCLSNFFLYA